MQQRSLHQILEEHWVSRRQKNPAYSLSAFARDLGLSRGRLSNLIQQKQGVSHVWAERLSKKLGLSDQERALFLLDCESRFARSPSQKKKAHSKLLQTYKLKQNTRNVDSSLFKTLCSWKHLAMLEAIKSSQKGLSADALIQRFGSSSNETTLILGTLLEQKLISFSPTKSLYTWKSNLQIDPKGCPSIEVKKYHDSLLHLAGQALYSQPLEQREYSSVVVALSPTQLKSAKAIYRRALEELVSMLQDGNQVEQRKVYALNLQCFSLEKEII